MESDNQQHPVHYKKQSSVLGNTTNRKKGLSEILEERLEQLEVEEEKEYRRNYRLPRVEIVNIVLYTLRGGGSKERCYELERFIGWLRYGKKNQPWVNNGRIYYRISLTRALNHLRRADRAAYRNICTIRSSVFDPSVGKEEEIGTIEMLVKQVIRSVNRLKEMIEE